MTSNEIALITNKPHPQPSVDHLFNPRVLEEQNITGDELVNSAILIGGEVTAVCGFQWHPTAPLGHKPVCETCQIIVDNI